MKLHLPIILLTALMAVMTTLPTYGNVSLTHDGKLQDEWDGRINEKYKGTVEITVDNEGSIKEVVCGQQGGTEDGDTTITVSGEGASFKFDTAQFAGQNIGYGNTKPSTLEINLLDHAEFTLGKADLGKANKGSTSAPITTLINVYGGSLFDMDGSNGVGSVGCLANYVNGEVAVTINVDGKGSEFRQTNGDIGSCYSFNGSYKQTSTANINVSGGGKFVFTSAGSSQANIGRSEGKESLSTVNILVEGESSSFDMYCNGSAACSIGQTSTYSSSGGADTSKIAITVKDGGCFNLKTVSKSSSKTVIGYVGKDNGSLTEVELNVGDLTLAEADAKKAQFLMVCEDSTSGGALIGYADRGKATTTINIGNGGSLVMDTKGIIGQATIATPGSTGMSSQAEVHISMIGNASLSMEKVGTSDTASNLIIGQAKYGWDAKNVSATVEITMSGTSKFTLNTGGCIGGVDSSVDGVASAATAITMSENAQFVMSGGNIGYSGAKQNATEVTIELQDKAHFQWTKGTIGGSSETSSTRIVLRGESKLTRTATNVLSGSVSLYDGATYSTGSGHSSDQAITMHGGNLANATNYRGTSVVIDVDEAFSGAMKMGKLSAGKVTSFKANGQEVRLEDLGSGTLRLSGGDRIKLGKESAWVKDSVQGDGQRHALFQFTSGSGSVEVDTDGEGGKFYLDLKAGDLDFSSASDDGITVEVWITNGTLDKLEANDFEVGEGWGMRVEQYDADSGKLILTGKLNVWDAKNDGDPSETGHAEGVASELEGYDKVVIDENTTLNADADATLKQLQGDEGANLEITNDSEVERQITFYNKNKTESPSDHSGDTIFEGAISAGPNVNLKKTGDALMVVEGNLQASNDLEVNEGGLTLKGQGNTVGGTLTVGGEETRGTLDVQGNLNAQDVNVQNGTLTFGENSESSIGGELTLGDKGALQVDGKLTLSGTSDLSKDSDKLSGSGTIEVSGEDGSLTFGDETMADESELKFKAVDGGTLNYTGSAGLELSDLTGNGHYTGSSFLVNGDGSGEEQVFEGTVEGSLSLEGGKYNLTNPDNAGCGLVVGSDSEATLAAGSTYKSIDNHGTLSTSTSEGTENACITATGDIIFRNGAHSPVDIDLSEPGLSQGSSVEEINYKSTAGKIIIEKHTELDVTLTGNILDAKGDLNVVIMEAAGGIENPEKYKEEAANYEMKTVRFMAEPQAEEKWIEVTAVAVVAPGEGVSEAVMDQLYDVDNTTFWTKDGQLLTHIPQRTESPWEQYATTSNSHAGLGLLYRDLHQNGVMEADQDVVELINGVDRLVQSNPAEARRALAAVAGSTLTTLSAAQSAALRNQMGRVRDHALQAGRLRCMGNYEATAQQRPCRNSHVWVEGTSFFSEQHSVGDESGYRLNSWGGTLGIDAQVDAHWSVGVSLSASYGDLEARAADYAKGDLDTYTVSFWSQAKNGRWGNTLLFTLGTNEADLKRTVNYGAGSYTATSNTSGSSLGAMWEVTYDLHPVKDNKSNILQPLFNVAVMHTSMDGFSEGNAGGVGLTTEKQTRDTVTLGLGLRWLAAINSAKAVNRTMSTEVHANVAQDMGDRRSVANVALLADPNFTQSVYGSKAGSTAFQFGAGVNVPMTPNSQIYVNAGGELREHANAWNAALGIRMGF